MKILLILAALITVALLFRRWLFLRRNRYVGFGWLLDWKEGKVIVSSTLLESPAGRKKVPRNTQLLTYDGHDMTFATGDEWVAFSDSLPDLAVGDLKEFVLATEDGGARVIGMKAEVIQGPIPWHPPFTPHGAQAYGIVYGMRQCPKTGQYYETRRLNRFVQALRTS